MACGCGCSLLCGDTGKVSGGTVPGSAWGPAARTRKAMVVELIQRAFISGHAGQTWGGAVLGVDNRLGRGFFSGPQDGGAYTIYSSHGVKHLL